MGQIKDPSAMAVVEREDPVLFRFDYVSYLRRQEKLETKFLLRYLERVPLGTSYPAIVSRVRDMVRTPELRGRCTLVVDGTGVGRPVVDLLRESDIDCEIVPVTITGGNAARRDGSGWTVPKRDLVASVQVLLDQGRLTMAAGMPRLKTLMNELMSMRVRLTREGNEQFGAWREGEHDDLALALAMACWRAKGDERVVGEKGDGRLL
jgi:hypothetical protein